MYMQADTGFLEKRCQFPSWGNWWVQQVGGVLELAAFAPRCPLISRWEADGVLLLSLLLRPRLDFLFSTTGPLHLRSLCQGYSSFVSLLQSHISRDMVLESSLQSVLSIMSAHGFP